MPTRSLPTLILLLISGALSVAVPARSFGVGDVAVVNRTPLMTGAPALQAVTSDAGVALRGRFHWKTVHGEDVESFVLDVAFLDGRGGMLARSTFDSAAIRLGTPFDVPIGTWLPASGGVDRAALRQIVLTVRSLRAGLSC